MMIAHGDLLIGDLVFLCLLLDLGAHKDVSGTDVSTSTSKRWGTDQVIQPSAVGSDQNHIKKVAEVEIC